MYQRPELKRLENVTTEEYKLLCYLRNRRRRVIERAIRFEVVVRDGVVRCREIGEGKK